MAKNDTFSSLMAQSLEELRSELSRLRREYASVSLSIRMGQEKDTAKRTSLRKSIARICTAITAKEHNILAS